MFNWANVWKSHFTTSSNLTYALPVRNTVMKLGSARLHIATTVSVYCWEFACNVIAFTVSPLFLHLALSLSPCTASPPTYNSLSLFLPRMYEIEPPSFPTLASSICFYRTPNVNGVYRTQCGSHLSVTRWKICILWCTGVRMGWWVVWVREEKGW